MSRNRVREAQEYLAARNINMSETAIVDAALEIVCSQDLLYRFCLSAHLRKSANASHVCSHCGCTLHTKKEYKDEQCERCQEEYEEEMYAIYGDVWDK